MVLTIILPTLDEAGNIEGLIRGLRHFFPQIDGHKIVVVDDGSTDGTREIVDGLRQSDAGLALLARDPAINGLPGAIYAGVEFASTRQVAWLDADGSMPPSDLFRMWEVYAGNNAVVMGSRFVRGGGFKGVTDSSRNPFVVWRNLRASNDSVLAVILSRLLNIFLRVVLGHGIRDYTSGFIICERDLVMNLGLPGSYGDYFPVFIFRVASRGIAVTEIPFLNLPRTAGESKTGSSLPSLIRRGIPYVTAAVKVRISG